MSSFDYSADILCSWFCTYMASPGTNLMMMQMDYQVIYLTPEYCVGVASMSFYEICVH
jgi:ribosomal protein L24E